MQVQDALRTALGHQNGGRLGEAERIYREVLRAVPGHPVAAALLGRIAFGAGARDDAVALLETAIRGAPDYVLAHSSLGEAHQAGGRADAAAGSFRRAVALSPGLVGAWVNLGNLASAAGDEAGAACCWRRALAAQPANRAAANNLAAAMLKLGDPPAARRITEAVLAADPGNVRTIAYHTAALTALGERDAVARLVGFGLLSRPVQLPLPAGWPDIDAFNRDLAAALRAHPNYATDWDPSRRAIRGGAIVRRLFEHRAPPVAAFERALRAMVDGYIAGLPSDAGHPYLSARPDAYEFEIWANLLGAGDHQAPHIHNLGWMSGVYYVAVPGAIRADDPARGGWLELNRPGYGIPYLGGPLDAVAPVAGMAVLFPSYVWHGTVPFDGAGERISIAFDLLPRPASAA